MRRRGRPKSDAGVLSVRVAGTTYDGVTYAVTQPMAITVQADFSATPGAAGVRCTIDSGAFGPCGAPAPRPSRRGLRRRDLPAASN